MTIIWKLNKFWNVLNKDGNTDGGDSMFRHSDSVFDREVRIGTSLELLAPESLGPGFKYFCIDQLLRLVRDAGFTSLLDFYDPFNTYSTELDNVSEHTRDLAALVTRLDGIDLASFPWATDFLKNTWVDNPNNIERLAAATISLSVLGQKEDDDNTVSELFLR